MGRDTISLEIWNQVWNVFVADFNDGGFIRFS